MLPLKAVSALFNFKATWSSVGSSNTRQVVTAQYTSCEIITIKSLIRYDDDDDNSTILSVSAD